MQMSTFGSLFSHLLCIAFEADIKITEHLVQPYKFQPNVH